MKYEDTQDERTEDEEEEEVEEWMESKKERQEREAMVARLNHASPRMYEYRREFIQKDGEEIVIDSTLWPIGTVQYCRSPLFSPSELN